MVRVIRPFVGFVLVIGCVFTSLHAQEPKAPASATPTKKIGKDGKEDKGFIQLHGQFVKTAKDGGIDVAFWGDSITAGWRGAGKDVWAKHFAPLKAANFGIGGDRTQHVLWRILDGELEHSKPKVAVVMIGTNNVGTDDANDIALGVKTIVSTIREKSPDTKVLLLAVFPRGKMDPDPSKDAGNLKLVEVNKVIAKLDNGKTVRFLDFGEKLLADGKMSKDIMPDSLHLSARGYEIWAEAMLPLLKEMLEGK